MHHGLLASMFLLVFTLAAEGVRAGQSGTDQPKPAPDLKATAREIMTAAHYCALITVDETGQAQARVMDAFLPEDDLTVWMGTNRRTRKVAQIRRNPKVTLFYFDPASLGYVTLIGTARLVDDPKEKAARWKEEWKAFYPDREESYLLIAVTPERLEIVSPTLGIEGDAATWRPPALELASPARPR